MAKLPYVCLYRGYRSELALYTDEEVGRLVRALLDYLIDGTEPTLPERESLFWNRLRDQHDRDTEHYEEVCESRSTGAKRRWERERKRKEKVNMYTQHSEYGKENEKEKDKDKEKEKERESIYRELSPEDLTLSSFSPPSLDDVISFCTEEGLRYMDPKKFFDFNSMVGWTVKGTPMRDWKAAARVWNSKDAANAPKAAEEVWYGEVL